MSKKATTLTGLFLASLLLAGATLAGGNDAKRGTTVGQAPPTGAYVSVSNWKTVVRDSSGATLVKLPDLTLWLEPNKTYRIECSHPDADRSVIGNPGLGFSAHQGVAQGTWEWNTRSHELTLVCTNNNGHVSTPLPRVLRYDGRYPDRLEEVTGHSLFSPYFIRKKE